MDRLLVVREGKLYELLGDDDRDACIFKHECGNCGKDTKWKRVCNALREAFVFGIDGNDQIALPTVEHTVPVAGGQSHPPFRVHVDRRQSAKHLILPAFPVLPPEARKQPPNSTFFHFTPLSDLS